MQEGCITLHFYFCRMTIGSELLVVDTSLAVVRRTAPDRVEVHFKEGRIMTVEGIREMLQARERMCESGPHSALMVLTELVDFEMPSITTDHHHMIPQPDVVAVDWVTHNDRNDTFMRMYMAYFPPPFPCEVFFDEAAARMWLGW